VTIVFADLVGFTPFAEERDAEDVREKLTEYFDLSRLVIERYGGTIEKFIGDAVMAVWGAPVAREDDAERAVRAALDLVDAVRSLGPSMQARAGVLTGEAAVTLGAVGQGMVAGDLVNTASRLQSAAPAGWVLVGEATHRAASGSIVFEEAGEQALKGKSAPVRAWRAARVVAEIGGRNRSEKLEAPFVGREEELRLLKDLLHATGRDRRARLVSVTGQAGIGKSRLSWEFLKYIDGLIETVWWHSGRSPAYGDGITFWALGEMVRSRAGLVEGDDEPTTRAKVAEMLARWVPDEDERRWIEPAMLALLGSGTVPPASAGSLFAAWRTFFERIAQQGTVLMVFEDLQWADSGLLDFIDHLLEWSKGVPVLIVTLARPELLERRLDWGAGKRNFVSVSLEPLTEPQMRELLAGLVPGLPDSAARLIASRSDGIPLYAVETVRMLVGQGLLREEGGVFMPAGDLKQVAVPETLAALVAARLDGLEPADRGLLQDASVLGQSFSASALSAISRLSVPEIEAHLHGMVRRDLLTAVVDPRSPERGQYVFVQGLIREVAYGTLARRDRKARHLAAARWFESLGDDTLAGALATQYVAAHRSAEAGPEAEALAAQARVALRGAAERAASLGSYAQAVALLEEALSVTDDVAEQAEFHERAGVAASTDADPATADRHLLRALELRRESGDRVGIARVATALGRARNDVAQADRALEILGPVAEESRDLMPDPAVIQLGAQLARSQMLLNRGAEALVTSERVLEAAEHADLVAVIADVMITRGTTLNQLQRTREGSGLIRVGAALAEQYGLSGVQLRGLNNLASVLSETDPVAALGVGKAALQLARRLGLRGQVVRSVGAAGYAATVAGEWDWSIRETEGELADLSEPALRALLLYGLIPLLAYRDEPYLEQLTEFMTIRGPEGDSVMATQPYDMRALVELARGNLESSASNALTSHRMESFPIILTQAARARTWLHDAAGLQEVLDELEASGAQAAMFQAERISIRAALAAMAGDTQVSLRLYADALAAWQAAGLVFDEALTGVDMAVVLDPSIPEVAAAAERSRAILERLKAKALLSRLDAAVSRPRPPAREHSPAPVTGEVQEGVDALAAQP
jgi:class 3 adenylate cyclase/tetratricopeptide (TPR) repeat protein